MLPVIVSIPRQHAGVIADGTGVEGRPAAGATGARGAARPAEVVSHNVHAEPARHLERQPIGLEPALRRQDVKAAVMIGVAQPSQLVEIASPRPWRAPLAQFRANGL